MSSNPQTENNFRNLFGILNNRLNSAAVLDSFLEAYRDGIEVLVDWVDGLWRSPGRKLATILSVQFLPGLSVLGMEPCGMISRVRSKVIVPILLITIFQVIHSIPVRMGTVITIVVRPLVWVVVRITDIVPSSIVSEWIASSDVAEVVRLLLILVILREIN